MIAAPHVSLDYWKSLLERYSEYTNKNHLKDKKLSALLTDSMQPALDYYIESNDYEDAKLIWLTRGQNKKKELDTKSTNNNNNISLSSVENRLKYLSSEDSLNSITYHISKKYLIKGDPIMASANFLSVKDTFNAIKTLIRSNELEIAYLLVNIINDKNFEEDIYFGLCMKEYKKGNM